MAVAIVTSCCADISLKHGLVTLVFPPIHTFSDAIRCVGLVLGSMWMVAGIVLIVTDFTAFFKALELGSLTVVIPLRSTTYVLTSLLAHVVLGEPIPLTRWLALALILAGVFMVGRSAMESL
jgi:drug/metabolite transporter (DMT)-like permease